jgi:L-alanine-DL-glutamate epimerase-like enolase superfamily enzyme
MYRFFHFRGSAIVGVLGALDIVHKDIAEKSFGVPVYRLLDNQLRDIAVFITMSSAKPTGSAVTP